MDTFTTGKTADWTALYSEYYQKILSYVLGKVTGYSDAEDITSNVFVKVYSNFSSYDCEKGTFSAWIYAIAKNEICDFFREKKFVQIPYEEAFAYMEMPCMDNYDVQRERLHEGINSLSRRQREVIIMHYYYGLKHCQIAEKLQISHTNVRKICSLALAGLRKSMV